MKTSKTQDNVSKNSRRHEKSQIKETEKVS
jgi:hypothetical protein